MGKFIPIEMIDRRQSKLNVRRMCYPEIYPLFESYNKKSSYNFKNIKESLEKWYHYSSSIGKNVSRVLELFDIVSAYGTDKQLEDITTIITEDVVPYIQAPVVLKEDILDRIKSNPNQTITNCLNAIKDRINETIECDRFAKNYTTLSKRFNITRLMENNIVHEDSVTETLYALCGLIDTYNMDMKSKFSIATETALYSTNLVGCDTINHNAIVETVTDYFLINYGTTDIPKFVDTIDDAIKKDRFISEDCRAYLEFVKDIHNRTFDKQLSAITESISYNDDTYYIELLENDMPKSLSVLYEIAILDKAKAIITRFKIAGVKSVRMLKEALWAIFVVHRLQDLKTGTKNCLSLIYYAFIIVHCLHLGVISTVVGLLCNWLLHGYMQKKYLKEAIEGWKEHKYGIQRKIRECDDPAKKKELEIYLDEIDKNLEILINKYEEVRDRTTDELKKDIEDKRNAPGYKPQNGMVNPMGGTSPLAKYVSTRQADKDTTTKYANKSQDVRRQDDDDDDLADYEAYMASRNRN